jgi:GGDEF domain-containing protein
MALTNARFGAAVGNQVILLCSRHLAAHLASAPGDQLFRWSGPAFVAILERPGPDIDVQTAVQHAMTAPMSRFFDTPSRTVYLPIKMTAETMALQGTSYAEVADAVERFVLTASASPGSD